MADTVKGFPIRNQVQIKAKIFEIVNSVKMKLANNNEATDNEKQRSHNVLNPRCNNSYNTLSAAPSQRFSQVQDRIETSQNNVLVVHQDIIPQNHVYTTTQTTTFQCSIFISVLTVILIRKLNNNFSFVTLLVFIC